MTFVCKKRGCPGVGLSSTSCSKCGLAFTITGLFRYARQSVSRWIRAKLSISCPKCHALIPPFRNDCKACGETLTVSHAVESAIGPHRKRIEELITPTSPKQRLVQWIYLLSSVVLFWVMLGRLEAKFAENWKQHALLSVVYLAAFLLVSMWLVPQKTLMVIAQRASKFIKLALVFNYLTALFLLQMFIATWWLRSFMLGMLFLATIGGAYFFWRYLWPMATAMTGALTPQPPVFNPRNPQGRTVTKD